MKRLFSWTVKSDDGGVVAPSERLSWPRTIAMGIQHIFAMFGATLLAPMLMGFESNVAILMSGIGTLVFFIITQGRVPSYLGSSFAFIGVVIAATGYSGHGSNINIGIALGGIVLCGAVYIAFGGLVKIFGVNWIEVFTPPVVTGTVVAVIGLNLASVPIKTMAVSDFDSWMQLLTVVCVAVIAVYSTGMIQRMLLLVGLSVSTVVYYLLTQVTGLGKQIDFSAIDHAEWLGIPMFSAPDFTVNAALLIVPVVIILIAENLGHLKAISSITTLDLRESYYRAFVGDGIATVVSAGVGGPGVTTYAENIGVMAATKVYSTAVFVVAAFTSIFLGFSPKFGALVHAIPVPVMGGVSIVVFGLIAVSGAKIWIENRVDFSDNRNLLVAAIPLIFGTGDFTLHVAGFALSGLGTATFGAIILNQMLTRKRPIARSQPTDSETAFC